MKGRDSQEGQSFEDSHDHFKSVADDFHLRTVEELRHWPYTIHQIDDTLDSALIEGRGKQILFQALNSTMLTAFVGSGVSMAYGRLTWIELKNKLIQEISDICGKFLSTVDASIAYKHCLILSLQKRKECADRSNEADRSRKLVILISWLQYRQQILARAKWEVTDLGNTFTATSSEIGEFPGGDGQTVTLEIANKLHDLLMYHSRIFLGESKHTKLVGSVHQTEKGAPSLDDELIGYLNDIKSNIKLAQRNNPENPEAFKRASGLDEALDAYEAVASQLEANETLHTLSKIYLVDERAHGFGLLASAIERGWEVGRPDDLNFANFEGFEKELILNKNNLRRDVRGIRDEPEHYQFLRFFTLKKTQECAELASEHSSYPECLKPLARKIGDELEKYNSKSRQGAIVGARNFLTPSSRFLVPLLWKGFEQPFQALFDDSLENLKPDDFGSRRSIIADRFDPLVKLAGKLKIRRYLTTNYDFEIERMYQDRGYRQFDYDGGNHATNGDVVDKDPYNFRSDGVGGVMRDFTFKTNQSTDLLTFSTSESDCDASIFHLHGRATEDDEIVVTERDYMDMYLREDVDRHVVNESIQAAFSSTPILFLGLGMTETDLLRPLRQFMSDQDRMVGYRAVVLLAATDSFEQRTKTAASLYMKYGAHTIFYGGGEVCVVGAGGDKTSHSIDWLYRIMSVLDVLSTGAKNRRESIQKYIRIIADQNTVERDERDDAADLRKYDTVGEFNKPLIDISELESKVGEIGKDLAVGEQIKEDDPALAIMLGKSIQEYRQQVQNGGLAVKGLTLQSCDFTAQRRAAELPRGAHTNVRIDGAKYNQFYLDVLNELLRLSLSNFRFSSIPEALRVLASVEAGLNGLKGAFITANFSAAIDGIEAEWRAWWSDWQRWPPSREARFEQIAVEPLAAGQAEEVGEEHRRRCSIPMPSRHVRHRVESVITSLDHCLELTAPLGNEVNQEKYQVGVNIFDQFLVDVSARKPGENSPASRVIQSLSARRGQGKGVFFSVMNTRLGLSSYISRMHGRYAGREFEGSKGKGRPPVFISAMFVNLSFAPEIGSVFEMLTRSLVEAVGTLRAFGSTSVNDYLRDDDICPNMLLSLYLNSGKSFGSAVVDALVEYHAKHFMSDRHGMLLSNDEWKARVRRCIEFLKNESEAQSAALVSELTGLSRLESIFQLMEQFAHHSRNIAEGGAGLFNVEKPPRLLICINAVDVLFDGHGRPKTMELSTFLEAFYGDRLAGVPFDLISIGNMERMSGMWSSTSTRSAAVYVNSSAEKDVINRSQEIASNCGLPLLSDKEYVGDYRIHPKSDFADPAVARKANRTSTTKHYIYVAHRIKPREFLVKNFPLLALALVLRPRGVSDGGGGPLNKCHETMTNLLSEAYKCYLTSISGSWTNPTPPVVDVVYRGAERDLVLELVRGFLAHAEENPGLSEYFQIDLQGIRSDSDGGEGCSADVVTAQKEKRLHEIRTWLLQWYRGDRGYVEDSRDWVELRRAMAGNRYCLTILLAAAQYLVQTSKDFAQGGEEANAFLRNTVSHLLNASNSVREEVVLQSVMNVYKERSIIGDPENDHELHLHILRSLAVVGCPLSPNVIVRLPEIRDYFNRVSTGLLLSRRRIVARVLATLSARGLVFRLRPHPKLVRLNARYNELKAKKDDEKLLLSEEEHSEYDQLKKYSKMFLEWPAEVEYRYSLHRQVQSYCFKRLGHLSAQPTAANTFAPTLYASMPSRVVRLSHEGYMYLRRLMVGLSQYPDIRHSDTARDMPIFSRDDVSTKVQALRAAMSLARTSYSIATVSRLDPDTTDLKYVRKRGLFETYKVRLRWVLRKAWEIHGPEAASYANDPTIPQLNALYIDEIVWLYNEVGVICLAQGGLFDAIGHLRQAILINKEIEGDSETGPMHNMISLNLAIAQIDRGRLNSAERRLNSIIRCESKVRRRIYHLAVGYRGLISHLKGRLPEALKDIDTAIEYLEKDRQDRALAIFNHHLARLLASSNVEAARKRLRIAADYAEAGGHDDIRHRVRLSDVWISQNVEAEQWKRVTEDRVKLASVEQYARLMGLHSLLVDVMHEQGRLLFNAGDNLGAGRLLTRALAIARRNDMALRLNSIMGTYASVLVSRGRVASAKRLLLSAMRMAKRAEHSSEVFRLQGKISDVERRSLYSG